MSPGFTVIEIASSQSLRNTLEQMSLDLLAAGLDPLASAGAGIGLADTRQVDLTLDGNADGVIGGGVQVLGWQNF
jgi:hypothetical protein